MCVGGGGEGGWGRGAGVPLLCVWLTMSSVSTAGHTEDTIRWKGVDVRPSMVLLRPRKDMV